MNQPQPDQPTHHFIHRIAQRLVELAQPKSGDTVLEIAAGLEAVTLYTAAKVGTMRKVITLDLAKIAGVQLPFAVETFDSILCASAIVLLPDLQAALCEWRRVLKPGGTVAFSGFGHQAMQPLLPIFITSLQRYGVSRSASIHPFWGQQFTELEQYSDLLRNAGFSAIDVRGEQLGHYLADSDEWWDIVWHSGFCGPLAQLTPDALSRFKAEHLADVTSLATAQGIWLNVAAIFAVGRKNNDQTPDDHL